MEYMELTKYDQFRRCENIKEVFEVIDKLNTSRDVYECECVTKSMDKVKAYVLIEIKVDGRIRPIKCYGIEYLDGWDDDEAMFTRMSFDLKEELGWEYE